jgi:hypothetical protein
MELDKSFDTSHSSEDAEQPEKLSPMLPLLSEQEKCLA